MRIVAGALLLVLVISGCRSTEQAVDPDSLYGHRFEGEAPDGREVIVPRPPRHDEEFFLMPAFVTDVDLRHGDLGADGRRPIDMRIEGSVPDACTHPNSITEHRLGHIITLEFQLRRDKGAVCAQVVRRFVVYHELADRLAPGSYTLRLNEAVHPFQVFPELEPE